MGAKFTPGLWRIEDGEVIADGPDGPAILGHVYGVGDFPCLDDDIDEECKANARLIAAAPLMYEFIRRVAWEPIGHAEAGAGEVLGIIEAEARAILAAVEEGGAA
jgi:hypothetical protein